MDWVRDGGGNNADNLIALCPNCHSLHTAGNIPAEAIMVWKGVLVSLMNPNRASADVLLALDEDERRFAESPNPANEAPRFRFHGDSLGFLSGLISAGLVRIGDRVSGVTIMGNSSPSFEVRLTETGRAFVQAWRAGNADSLREAVGYPLPEVQGRARPQGQIAGTRRGIQPARRRKNRRN